MMSSRRHIQNLEEINENRNERGCTFEYFTQMLFPPTFDGMGDPTIVEDWI